LSSGRVQLRAARAVGPVSYARLFPDLPPFTPDESFLYALGRAGGLCDCGTSEDDAASLGSEAAGWPFFGQFIAHDITADRSALRTHLDPSQLKNARSPQLNLECLYGDGPVDGPRHAKTNRGEVVSSMTQEEVSRVHREEFYAALRNNDLAKLAEVYADEYVLDVALRCTRFTAGTTGQENRRSARAVPDPPAGRDHGRV
jgi:hypothetical protein